VAVLPRGPGLPAEWGPLFPDPAPSGGAGGAAITLVEVGPAGAA